MAKANKKNKKKGKKKSRKKSSGLTSKAVTSQELKNTAPAASKNENIPKIIRNYKPADSDQSDRPTKLDSSKVLDSSENDDSLMFEDEDIPHLPTKREKFFRLAMLLALIGLIVGGYFAKIELTTSKWQAKYFHKVSSGLTKNLVEGPGEIFKSPNGPYDLRLGFSKLNNFKEILEKHSFTQVNHTIVSENAYRLAEYGINFPYPEKAKAGITIYGAEDELLYRFSEPSWVFESFDSISHLITDTLLFIENRTILQNEYAEKNPAVEWDRFFKAIIDLAASKFTGARDVPGGSTLATQIEKFKHSDGGRTSLPTDKLRQMYSASLRAYHASEKTYEARKDIVLDYINSVPLAAVRGYGEIHGLGDGLWAYYGSNPQKVNAILNRNFSELTKEEQIEQSTAYRKVLSLFLAHRRPSDYLAANSTSLQKQVDIYLPLLFKQGIISYDLFKLTLGAEVSHRRTLPVSEDIHFSMRKGPNVIRNHLLNALELDSLYELDRLDLEVKSSINVKAQEEVSRQLLRLNSRDEIKKLGLDGFRLLSTNADPKKVIYSFTLYENDGVSNKLRIQTDTFDQPFNINEGVKLDLGSTAKFRTIITYLEVIEDIFHRYKGANPAALQKALTVEKDPLSLWTINWLRNTNDKNKTDLLNAALDRQYSASTAERFFTAGGVHRFSNFNARDNDKVMPIRLALRHSVNLPFIRLMRDIVHYFKYHTEGSAALTLSNMDDSKRTAYLKKFADQEGKVFLRRFYDKYKDKTPDQIISILLDTTKHLPKRFAAIYWFLYPEAGTADFIAFMKKYVDHASINEKQIEKLHKSYSNNTFSLGDKGYLARMHPLELWLADYLIKNQDATLTTIFENSFEQRIEVYDWLMKTSRKHAQDKRIQILLEAEAFQEIYQRWKNVGYPLSSLVPSYATALGTSADRPDALAELMGIVLNRGKRFSKASVEELRFAKDTPYETTFSFKPKEAEQVISEEIAAVAKPLLLDVVTNGTAIRLKDGIKIGQQTFAIGGKTGTGDHRYQVFGKGGRLLEKRVVNRTATFMFIMGDRYYGVLTAFVPGREAEKFKFTSALPVQIFKIIAPALTDLND